MSTREYPNPVPSGHCQPGAARLQAWGINTFKLTNLGCYNPNSHLSGGGPSWHVHGEAIDLGCNWYDETARGRGNAWFAWLIQNREALNLQQAIWGNTIYDVSYGVRAYNHEDHKNHIHAALGHAAAQNWYPPGTPAPLPPAVTPTYVNEDNMASVYYEVGNQKTVHSFWIDSNNELQHHYGGSNVENMAKYGLKNVHFDPTVPVVALVTPDGALHVRVVRIKVHTLITLDFDSVHGWGKNEVKPAASTA